jgi:ABC-type ATPase with predicted acetyltransferase domain
LVAYVEGGRVFENMVLRRIFWPKRDEVTGEWRKLHNEELNDLYSSLNIVRLIKSRIMRCEGHVARIGRVVVHTGFWWGYTRERDHLKDPDLDGLILR